MEVNRCIGVNMGNEKVIGLYNPTPEEEFNCRAYYKSCDFGICSECRINQEYLGEYKNEE